MPETIGIEKTLDAGLWEVELDETSAENAIVNILLNGRDAMLQGGKMTIETSNVIVGDAYAKDRSEGIESGRYVMLAISDTGHGIPQEKLEKIFDLSFTVKPVGLGSGLGLSMVQGSILVAGDEEDVMRILKRMLEDAGYEVTCVKNGDEALAIINSPNQFDLLLADIVMPGTLLGPALSNAARFIDPKLLAYS